MNSFPRIGPVPATTLGSPLLARGVGGGYNLIRFGSPEPGLSFHFVCNFVRFELRRRLQFHFAEKLEIGLIKISYSPSQSDENSGKLLLVHLERTQEGDLIMGYTSKS